jgi:glycosyltransferase involved in cell wall biosynthesis
MNILQIAPQIPYPLVDGGKIGIFNITKYVTAQGHKVDFVAYYNDDKSLAYQDAFSGICTTHFIKHNTKNNVGVLLRNLLSPVPYNFDKYYSRTLKDFLVKFLSENHVDVVHVDHAHLAWVVDVIRPLTDAKVVLREHNFEVKIMQRYYQGQKNLALKLFAYWQYKKMLRYEPGICSKFDCCIMISSQDEAELLKLSPDAKTTIIPVGIDEELLKLQAATREPHSLSHIGSLEWVPNRDGLTWFVKEVFPYIIRKIPDTKLYLIGKYTEEYKVPAEFKNNIIPLGFVQKAFEKILETQLTIIPLHVGGGIRVKIFELMAIGQPILSTSVGKEGIQIENGEHLFVEDDAQKFAERVLYCMNNPDALREITGNAKRLVREKYSWVTIAKSFERAYSK